MKAWGRQFAILGSLAKDLTKGSEPYGFLRRRLIKRNSMCKGPVVRIAWHVQDIAQGQRDCNRVMGREVTSHVGREVRGRSGGGHVMQGLEDCGFGSP